MKFDWNEKIALSMTKDEADEIFTALHFYCYEQLQELSTHAYAERKRFYYLMKRFLAFFFKADLHSTPCGDSKFEDFNNMLITLKNSIESDPQFDDDFWDAMNEPEE
jgi:hypothetical protein